jgi:dolichyl-phosphate-mannose--protein O-mannosyl transferase
MLDIFGTVFMLTAFLALHRALTVDPGRALKPILACGLCLSLAIATKWNAVYPAALAGAWLLARTVWLGLAARRGGGPDAWRGVRAHAVGLVLGLIVLPPLVYLVVYIPFFVMGHSFAQFVELQRQTWVYHSHLHATHPYQSKWWQWPLAQRPVWYWTSGGPGPRFGNVFALGNPLIAWALVPGVIAACGLAWRRRDMGLPWALVPRIAFAYHFLPATTIGVMALALVLVALAGRGGAARTVAVAYVIAVLAAAVYFYPMRAAVPLTGTEIEARMWMPSWH